MIAAKPIFDRQVLVMHFPNTERPAWHRGAFAVASLAAHGLLVLVLLWHGPSARIPRALGSLDTVAIDSIDEDDDTSTDVSVAKDDPRETSRGALPTQPPNVPPAREEKPPPAPDTKPPLVPEPEVSATPPPRPTSSAAPRSSASSAPSTPTTSGTGEPAPRATGTGSGEESSFAPRAERNLIAAFLHELPFFAGAMDAWTTLPPGDGGRLKVSVKVSAAGKVIDVQIEDATPHRVLRDALDRTTQRLLRGTYGLEKSEVSAGSATFVVHATLSDVAAPDDPGGAAAIKRNIEKRTAEFTTSSGRRVEFQLERVELTKN